MIEKWFVTISYQKGGLSMGDGKFVTFLIHEHPTKFYQELLKELLKNNKTSLDMALIYAVKFPEE